MFAVLYLRLVGIDFIFAVHIKVRMQQLNLLGKVRRKYRLSAFQLYL
jgi:hypothetical protein